MVPLPLLWVSYNSYGIVVIDERSPYEDIAPPQARSYGGSRRTPVLRDIMAAAT